MRSTGSPFMDKGTLRAFLKDPLLKKLENYSTSAETAMHDRTVNRTLSLKSTSI